MLQPTPTLPIPGQKQNPSYSLNDGIGGVCSVSVNLVAEQYGTFGFAVVNYSNLIAIYSDSISKPGYTIITSTSYSNSNLTGSNAPYTVKTHEGFLAYDYPDMAVYLPLDNPQNLVVSMSTDGTYTGVVEALLEINLLTVQYQYPTSFTQEELFEDLKTLPKIVITELKKLDCEKMQGALGLLEAFNSAKLAS